MEKLRIVWFSTGRDKAARDLLTIVLENIKSGEINGEILSVFSNRRYDENPETNEFFKLVGSHHLPLSYSCSAKFFSLRAYKRYSPEWRIEYDREVMTLLARFNPDICVLAGYMLIVGPEMCQKYKMINLHPAAPGGPQGTWQEVIWKLIERDAEETGAMMHLVTPELDKGPPVAYCTFRIRGEPFDEYWEEVKGKSVAEIKAEEGGNNPLFKKIRAYGLIREFPLIVATLKAFSQGMIRIVDGRILDARGEKIPGYNLTPEIDELVEQKI